jgi:acyl carrier protein
MAEHSVSAGEAFRAAKNDEEMVTIVRSAILKKLSEELVIPLKDLEASRNITSYNLDSLTAIELRNWIAREFRTNLQILELLSSGSVNGLSVLIVRKVSGG